MSIRILDRDFSTRPPALSTKSSTITIVCDYLLDEAILHSKESTAHARGKVPRTLMRDKGLHILYEVHVRCNFYELLKFCPSPNKINDFSKLCYVA